ncbi:L-ascorbate metabolism protein UlaG, beta-lactamase superfamily [Hymenobacter daecheongensis DSM 21074]|uniref:L-ascorbate metabolism protein UlaG, beta-lactamase superfamily n=1 Tax=Hymenobacter daecheongensis DSM 21074 TaxID=1121955 RepID=A0A1M6GUH3_9BACT|nr:MBL fold metallo-hydrolase [Hymenobacter daecheongensis]SHJ13593.1 L-ascorbate metabolism protein UlaG, beta-lactamase superfamily [Hymenobacter daecheongensis DSM 21074]
MRTSLKIVGRLALSLLALVLVAGVAFANLSPELGGKPTKAQKLAYARSGHYEDGEFRNLVPTTLMTGGSTVAALWRFLFEKVPHKNPAAPLPMQPLDSLTITRKTADLVRVTWFGHSASLVEIAGRNILLDPMLSVDMGPISWLTPNRYNPVLPITAEKLPPIDAVLISHDHYDHLDYQSIRRLKDKTANFYVPLGVGAHLLAWGVAPEKVHELDWNDSVQLPGLTIISTPARHFSGRGLTNRNSTSWSSWVIKSATKRIFYSGDGGYGPHFSTIGQRHGPFDLALMECGQYDRQWAEIHMMPEQTVQASLDVRAKVLLPVHWGAFTEANHAWDDPIRRATAEAARLRLPMTTPQLGQPVMLAAGPLPQVPWWR